ncbi:hypothetical protein ACFLTH_14725 [Bacteroidota bacterium]
MNYELEYNTEFSRRAIIYAVLLHIFLMGIAAIFNIHKSFNHSNGFVSVDFVEQQISIPENESVEEEILQPINENIVEELNPQVDEQSENINLPGEISAPSDDVDFIIDDNLNSLLDSVILSNPSLYGLKTIVNKRMKKEAGEKQTNPTPIERAREQLKIQLIALYKDRYGDISPDKYAAQLYQKENTLSIPIPIDSIVDLLSEIF